MATTTTERKCLKAIRLPCPFCGEAEASIAVNLGNLDDDDCQFQCRECEAEFGRATIDDIVAKWSKVMAWLDLAPEVEE